LGYNSIKPAMIPTHIALAKAFQIDNNLDISDLEMLIKHDFIHAFLGLGVSSAEEDLVGAIELVLYNGAMWNVEALELARSLPVEFRSLYKFGNI
jgi:hypothetical protein